MTRLEVGRLLNRINAAYNNKLNAMLEDQGFFEMWYESLKDYGYDEINACLVSYIRSSEYLPTSASLLARYDAGIAKISAEVSSGCNWLAAYNAKGIPAESSDTWKQAYKDYVASFPVIQQMSVAKAVIRAFTDYCDENDGKEVSFINWLERVKIQWTTN